MFELKFKICFITSNNNNNNNNIKVFLGIFLTVILNFGYISTQGLQIVSSKILLGL